MNLKIISNDIARSKLVTITMVLFVAAASALVSLATILTMNLSGAIDSLMTNAQTPHFLQMHTGPLDRERLEQFSLHDDRVDSFQVQEFLNLEGSQIYLGDASLSDSVQDNGVVTQNQSFDFLLDLNDQPIHPADGELWVPLAYMKDGSATVGESASIAGRDFVVAGFLRDSQMNSTLSSSKRFLISDRDFAAVREAGTVEYLIEFRLKDAADLGAFEADYVARGLEANGPTITYPLFRMINALSDGMMILILISVSLMVVLVAFLCIRFTLLTKIEQDTREIGVMKAIGLRIRDIKQIYLAKYVAIAVAGALLGYFLALAFQGSLRENIRLYMGTSSLDKYAPIVGVAGILLVLLAIIAYVNQVLNRLRKISPTEAIRFGEAAEKVSPTRVLKLSQNRALSVNAFLGVKDLLTRKKLYVTLFLILIISTIIMTVPQNIATTMSDKSFVQYLGIGQSDIIITLQQSDDIAGDTAQIEQAVAADPEIGRSVALLTKSYTTETAGQTQNIRIELGDHSVFPVAYISGSAPLTDTDIALSTINADELGKKVGDTLTVTIQGQPRDLMVSGIYSDVTNGGKTAKASFTDNQTDVLRAMMYLNTTDPNLIEAKVSALESEFSFAKVASVNTYTQQMFGDTIAQIKSISYIALLVAIGLTLLITLLFVQMIVVKDRREIAILKYCGFTTADITAQYLTRTLGVTIVAILLGIVLANTLGAWLAGLFLSQIGATSVRFITNPWLIYAAYPAFLALSVIFATMLGMRAAKQITIANNIRE
ncbi:ABC transporter permease [Corynebacterium sp. S7]